MGVSIYGRINIESCKSEKINKIKTSHQMIIKNLASLNIGWIIGKNCWINLYELLSFGVIINISTLNFLWASHILFILFVLHENE